MMETLSQVQNLAEQHVLLSLCFDVIIDIFAKFNSPFERHHIFIYPLQMNNWLSRYGDICGHHADKIYFWWNKIFPFEIQKDNFLYFSNVFSHIDSHSMLHDNQVFFSIPYLPLSKPALLILFSGKYKNCFRRPTAL